VNAIPGRPPRPGRCLALHIRLEFLEVPTPADVGDFLLNIRLLFRQAYPHLLTGGIYKPNEMRHPRPIHTIPLSTFEEAP